MSAIGDYIHYYGKNYLLYGINKRQEGPSPAFTFQRQRFSVMQRLNNLQTMSEEERNNLQNTLKSIFSSQTEGEGSKYIADVQQEIKLKLYDLFGTSLGKIDWSTGNITGIVANKKISQNNLNEEAKQCNIQLTTILKRLVLIEQIRSSLKSVEDKKNLQKKISNIYTELSDITKTTNRGIKTRLQKIVASSTIEKIIYPADNIVKNKHISVNAAQGVISSINDILSLYSSVPMVQKGDLFQYVIATAPIVARKGAISEIKESFKNVQGGDRSKIEINFNQFTDAINLKDLDFLGKGYTLSGNTAISWGASQNKIDVKLQWNGKDLGVSAKNIQLKNSNFNIHIVSGTSLLYLLQDEDSNYVNHYLNLIAEHPDMDFSAVRASGDAATKLTILYKALSGDTYKKNKADIFIINDNNSNNVYVYNISDLIKKACSNIDNFTEITANGNSINSIRLINNWNNSSYSARITQLISNVHAQKIFASLKTNII